MTEETVEAPKWLKELEDKREKRLKVRLGHEAGAGSPCLTCAEKCPGLDLHFWRKICKNCKCGKENHDVNDDDVYDYAQFQLLGSKPIKSKKILLPGRKEAVELEWAPKGQHELIEDYLKELPLELLPIKGSAAAQERKQLLQKQIPVHDIDPTLCHALTEKEIETMNNYIEHVKANSVGVGRIVQLNFNRGQIHGLGSLGAQVVANRFPSQISNVQTVQLQGSDHSNLLRNNGNFEEFDLDEAKAQRIGNLNKNVQELNLDEAKAQRIGNLNKNLQDLSLDEARSRNLNNLQEFTLEEGKSSRGLPHYARNSFNTFEDVQNPVQNKFLDIYGDENVNIPKGMSFPNYLETNPNVENVEGLPRARQELPHYIPGVLTTYIDQHQPQSMGNIKDLAYSTYDQNAPPNYNPRTFNVPESALNPSNVNIGIISDITYPTNQIKSAVKIENNQIAGPPTKISQTNISLPDCHRCKKSFEEGAIVISAERSDGLFHSNCFRCAGCNQNLADLVYFYHKETDNIYCGRDYAKIRGIPRCNACDELIFVKEYCLAENSTFHVKHFCCFECDLPLAGQNYVMDELQPFCLPCFENLKAERCNSCNGIIKPDEQGANLNGIHFHASDGCFSCTVCRLPLLGAKFMFKNRKLYCSGVCFQMGK